MRILLSFENFIGFGGTETYNLSLVRELERLGHDAAIYSPNHGALAETVRAEGIRVLTRAQLPVTCDLVIASDAATCHDVAGRYPDAVKIMVVHSVEAMLQAPPQLPGHCDALVVLNDRVRQSVEARAWHTRIVRLRQPLDLSRYRSLGPCRPVARKALVSSNYVDGPRGGVIEAACRANGLSVSWIGATSQPSATPELAVADADVVIGLGRTVIEAMAAGRAAYVYGIVGADGWVTTERYDAMEADGFAGMAFRDVQIDLDRMIEELGEWTEQMGEYNRDLASAHHAAHDHVASLLDLAGEISSTSPEPVSHADELAHLVRLHWHESDRAASAEREAATLRAWLSEREQEVAALRGQLAASEAKYETLRRMRRVRLAAQLARPLDHWRDGRKR